MFVMTAFTRLTSVSVSPVLPKRITCASWKNWPGCITLSHICTRDVAKQIVNHPQNTLVGLTFVRNCQFLVDWAQIAGTLCSALHKPYPPRWQSCCEASAAGGFPRRLLCSTHDTDCESSSCYSVLTCPKEPMLRGLLRDKPRTDRTPPV